MPFKSDSQRRHMFAMEGRGELPEGTGEKWAEHTPNMAELPERVAKHGRAHNSPAGTVAHLKNLLHGHRS